MMLDQFLESNGLPVINKDTTIDRLGISFIDLIEAINDQFGSDGMASIILSLETWTCQDETLEILGKYVINELKKYSTSCSSKVIRELLEEI
jgi:hypothetical protein